MKGRLKVARKRFEMFEMMALANLLWKKWMEVDYRFTRRMGRRDGFL